MLLRLKDYIRVMKTAHIDMKFKDKALKRSNKRLETLLHRSDQLHNELEQIMEECKTEFKVRMILEGQDENIMNLESDNRVKRLFKELDLDDSDIIYHKDSNTQKSRYYSWVKKNLFTNEMIRDSDFQFCKIFSYIEHPNTYMSERIVYFDTNLWMPLEEYVPVSSSEMNMETFIMCPKCNALVRQENLVSCICGHIFNKELITILSDSNGVIEKKIQYGRKKVRYEIEQDGKVYAATPGLIRGDLVREVEPTGSLDLVNTRVIENAFEEDEDGWSELIQKERSK